MKQTVRIFKALADETRLRILSLLLAFGELCVCDIMAALQLPQSTVSRHLAYLKNAGWVYDRREGIWMYYSLSSENNKLRDELAVLLKQHLASRSIVVEDQERLGQFSQNSNCG